MAEEPEELDAEFLESMTQQADEENRFESTSLAGVLSCRECRALVLEEHRGVHYLWHEALDDNMHDHMEDEELD